MRQAAVIESNHDEITFSVLFSNRFLQIFTLYYVNKTLRDIFVFKSRRFEYFFKRQKFLSFEFLLDFYSEDLYMFIPTEMQFSSSGNHTEAISPIELLKHKQLEALKSLTNLLVREVESLEQQQARIHIGLSDRKINLYEEVQRFEASMIRHALILTGGVQRKAAQLLGLKITTLNVKVKRYKIDIINSESVIG
jgi:DNA-binding protein Fis